MKNFLIKLVSAISITLISISSALAGNPVTTEVSEPSMLPLFAVAAIAFYIAKKRKK